MARGLRSNQAKALRRNRRERLEQIEKLAAEKAKANQKPAEADTNRKDGQPDSSPQVHPEPAVMDTAAPAMESEPTAAQPAAQDAEDMDIEGQYKKKQQGLGVAKKNLKGKKQSSVLNRGLHEKRKKGKKVPRAWFHGE